MRPSQTFRVLEELRNNSEAHLYRKGVELSSNDSQTVLDVYQQWLMLMMDLDYLHPQWLKRDAQRLWEDFLRVDVYDLNNCCAECLHLVRMQSSKGFKVLCKGISAHLYSFIKDDIARIALGDVFSAKRLIQLFSYTSRLSLRDIDLSQQMIKDYLDVESQILDVYDSNLIRRLNIIVKEWFSPYEPENLFPHHGPGGVAKLGRASLQTKYENLATDKRLDFAFGPNWSFQESLPLLDRVSEVVFVPKSYKTFRTISMEPPALQYLQQGVWGEIDRLIRSNKFMRRHFDVHDQTRNQRFAKKGSLDRSYATLDLSAASDTVSYELVKQVFRGTWLLRYLVACRSPLTQLPDKSIVALKKFAPMGSSLCFPIETIIFAAICTLVTREHHISEDFTVYGDDIIVPTGCASRAMEVLTTLGFKVNTSKSFYQDTCWFRESCGGEYCDGYDVTPVKVSRKYASVDLDVRIAKLIELANNAYVRDYRNLRYFFIRKLRDLGYKPLFSPTEILADNYTNYHAKKRWNPYLQRIEVKVSTLISKCTKTDLQQQDETIRYHHWLNSTANRKTIGDGFESVICKPMVSRVKETWRAKPYEELDQQFIDDALSKEGSRLSYGQFNRAD